MSSTPTSFYCRSNEERLAKTAGVAAVTEMSPRFTAVKSERALLEETLRASELKQQALLSTLSELVFVVAKDGTILEFSAPVDNDYMLSADGLVGRSVRELLPSQFSQQAMYYIEKTLRTGQVQVVPHQLEMTTGPRQFEARLAVYGEGQVLALVRDVTDRNYLEREIIEISNREQMRIGQDLHDGLGQHLTGITFLAKALERKLAQQSLPEAAEAGEINQLVMQAISQTRSLARGLFPVELETSGLLPAFIDLAERVQQMFDVTCELEYDETCELASRPVALHLFRLTQEAISNAIRHGQAKHILLRLEKLGDDAQLTIRDDGHGFHQASAQMKGLGLRIMSYRAQKIGGTLDLQPAPDGGTVVTCRFMIAPKELLNFADV